MQKGNIVPLAHYAWMMFNPLKTQANESLLVR